MQEHLQKLTLMGEEHEIRLRVLENFMRNPFPKDMVRTIMKTAKDIAELQDILNRPAPDQKLIKIEKNAQEIEWLGKRDKEQVLDNRSVQEHLAAMGDALSDLVKESEQRKADEQNNMVELYNDDDDDEIDALFNIDDGPEEEEKEIEDEDEDPDPDPIFSIPFATRTREHARRAEEKHAQKVNKQVEDAAKRRYGDFSRGPSGRPVPRRRSTARPRAKGRGWGRTPKRTIKTKKRGRYADGGGGNGAWKDANDREWDKVWKEDDRAGNRSNAPGRGGRRARGKEGGWRGLNF